MPLRPIDVGAGCPGVPSHPRLRSITPFGVKSGGLAPGSRVELRVGFLFNWVALHTAYERNRLFVDEQIAGPGSDGGRGCVGGWVLAE